MTKSTLTIDTPESCKECVLETAYLDFYKKVQSNCGVKKFLTCNFTTERHPDCPLVEMDDAAVYKLSDISALSGECELNRIIIANLRAQVEWLCERLHSRFYCTQELPFSKCKDGKSNCPECWREAAERAVKE